MIGRTNTEPETSAQMRSFAMHSAYFCSLLNVACASFDWAQALNSFDLGMMFSVILRSWHELLQFLLVLELQCPFWIFASFSWCIYCCWCCLIPRQHVSMQGRCLPLPPCPHAKAMPPKTPRKKTRTADAFAKKKPSSNSSILRKNRDFAFSSHQAFGTRSCARARRKPGASQPEARGIHKCQHLGFLGVLWISGNPWNQQKRLHKLISSF